MPDNFAQDPYNTQNYNRYGYVLNNPLLYVDYSGDMAEGAGETLLWLGAVIISSAVASWNWISKQAGDAGKWIGKQATSAWNWIGKQSKSVGDAIARPFRETGRWIRIFFGGGGSNGPVEGPIWLNVPMSLGSPSSALIPIFGPTGGDGMPLSSSGSQTDNNLTPMAAATSFALTAAIVDGPLPIGDAVGALAIGVTAAYVYGPELMTKMQKEIDRIATELSGPQGYQYSLRAVTSGYYPTVRGGTTWLNTGEIWKFGETTQGFGRYSNSYLNGVGMGLEMIPEFFGNQVEIKITEKGKIYGYAFLNGALPPGNKIFR